MDLEGSTFEGRTGVAMRRSRRAVSDVGVGITALDVSFSHLRPRREIIIGDAPDKLDVVEVVSVAFGTSFRQGVEIDPIRATPE